MKQFFQSSWRIVRCLLVILSIIIAWNVCVAILNIYNMKWYSVHFENSVAARFYTSIIFLMIMCVFCLPWIRYICIGSGLGGVGLMTVKLWNQTFIKDMVMEATGQWPTYSDATDIRAFCVFLILVASIWPHIGIRMLSLFKKVS